MQRRPKPVVDANRVGAMLPPTSASAQPGSDNRSAYYTADLIGKLYAEGGRGPDVFDCWGLVAECARRIGVELPPYPTHRELKDNQDTVFAAIESGCWRRLADARPGCLVLMKQDGWQSHIGFVLPGEMFIHVVAGQAVVKQALSHPLWCRKIVGFFSYEPQR